MSNFMESADGQSFDGIVRVLKKYAFSKHLMFLDVISASSMADPSTTVYSVTIKSEDTSTGFEDSSTFNTSCIFVGDVVRIRGVFEHTTEEKKCQLLKDGIWQKDSLFVRKTSGGVLELISSWDIETNGVFCYEESNYISSLGSSINTVSSSSIRLPNFIVQVKNKGVEKTLALLRSLYPTALFRESTTTVSKSKDRLILVLEGAQSSSSPTLAAMAGNDLLSQSVARVYPVMQSSSLVVAHADLDRAIVELGSRLPNNSLEGAVLRVQSFPSYAARKVVTDLPDVAWSPKAYTHVLNVLLVDAVWVLSVVPREAVVIEDIYESSNKFGVKSGELAGPGAESRVCKSINKLHEAMTRNDWVYSSADGSREGEARPLHSYGLCLDVGSSPGGWSTYLARHCSVRRVIGADKGLMNIGADIAQKVEHWQMLGQDAVERLRELEQLEPDSHRLDLYCCDANIAPLHSTELLVKCVEYGLFNDGARFVLTLKNTIGNQAEWTKAKAGCIELLKSAFSEVTNIDLLANTPKETTVTGVYLQAGK